MEAANTTKSPPEKVYLLDDVAGEPRKRFTAAHLAHVSTGEHRRNPRWLTLDLYRKPDGTYILHRTGFSVMYHAVGGCEGGERVTLSELLEVTSEGEACGTCRPLSFSRVEEYVREHPDTAQKVLLERNYYKLIEISTIAELIEELKFVPRNSRTGERVVSRPGQELLMRAAEHDEKIRELSQAIKDI